MPSVIRAAFTAISWLKREIAARQLLDGASDPSAAAAAAAPDASLYARGLVELDGSTPQHDDVISEEEQVIMEHFIDGPIAHGMSILFSIIAIAL
jgi:hypothetical protein